MVAMALSIKTEDADRLARQLAELTHESLTEAVTTALRQRLERERDRRRVDIRHQLGRLAVEYSALAQQDERTADEIIDYDERGVPR